MPEPTPRATPGPHGPGVPAHGGPSTATDPSAEIEALEEEVVDSVFAHSRLWAHLVVLASLTVGTLLAFREMAGYTEDAAEFPRLTFYIVLVMIAIRTTQLVVVARRDGQPAPNRDRLGREAVIFAWLVALGVLLVLVGLIPGALAFLAIYLGVNRPVKLWIAAVVFVVVAVSVQGLFVEILNLPFQPGTLFR